MHVRTKLFILLSAVLVIQLTGCSSLTVGKEEFACSGMPGSVSCKSARDMYQLSETGIVPSPMRKDSRNPDCADCVYSEDVNPELQAISDSGASTTYSATVIASESKDPTRGVSGKTLNTYHDEVINNYVSPRLPTEPVPIRTPSQVMRIWVAPYVDTNGDLIAPGMVFTEIEPRRWIYPEFGGNQKTLTPLRVSKSIVSAGFSSKSVKTLPPKKEEGTYSALRRFRENRGN